MLILLILYALSVPLIVVAFVNSTWQGLIVNFLCVQSYWCLNEVARDLEDPFVYDPNDLPLSRYQVNRTVTKRRIQGMCSCFHPELTLWLPE